MKSLNKSEDAVSPVVGVMLMLVVTIVVAAVIAVFASGVVVDTQKTPITQFGVSSMSTVPGYGGAYLETLTLVSKGGDVLNPNDIEIALICDGNTYTFDFMGKKYGTSKDNFTSAAQISAGTPITLTHYVNDVLSATGFAAGKSVEFTVIDKATGNSISSGTFIVS